MTRRLTIIFLVSMILLAGFAFSQRATTRTSRSGYAAQEQDAVSKWFRWEPVALIIFGAAAAVALAGIGSAVGISRPASMGLGAMQEDADLFLPSLVLSALPGTQGIYGFIIGFLALSWSGVLGGGNLDALTINQGWNFFFACMPVAFAGLISAMYQGNVCSAGIGLAAKDKTQWTKGMILGVFVEFYAILGFLLSILILTNIKV
ncbi:MAG: V-type ATP synthase subunit K [Candidatus Zixiibacteriota bacterium]